MSDLKGNPHYEQTLAALEVATDAVASGNLHPMDAANLATQSQAVLALAYEQRTANLIAWLTYAKPNFISGSPEIVEITGRLGL